MGPHCQAGCDHHPEDDDDDDDVHFRAHDSVKPNDKCAEADF